MACLKCGGTGITLDNKPCDCGIVTDAQQDQPLSPIEQFIPEIYRGQSDLVGLNEIVVGDLLQRKLQGILEEIVNKLPNHPSLFIDLSTSQVGAYEVYYAILEKIITKTGDLPKPVLEMFSVNELNIPRLQRSERGIGEGKDFCYNFILSDFKIEKYERLNEYVKIFKLKDLSNMKNYPLNMYHLVIKSTGGY